MQELNQWIENVTNHASWRMIGDRLGTTHSTIQRRLKQDTATAICELAVAYGANPVDGLLAANVISHEQLQKFSKRSSLSSFTDLELAQEIVNRLEAAQGTSLPSGLDSRREAKAAAESDDPDYDAIVDGINSGTEKFAAQKATEPLEEHWP